MSTPQPSIGSPDFEIRFESLSRDGGGLAFPCDERGQVDLDALSERCRNDYFMARAMLGRAYAPPRVAPSRQPCADSTPSGRTCQ